MSKNSRTKAPVWVLGLHDQEQHQLIGQAHDWNEAAIVFSDWCERQARDAGYGNEIHNGITAVAERYGLTEFPPFSDRWTFWNPNAECYGYVLNPGILAVLAAD